MQKVVKKVRRHGEAYDLVRTDGGKLMKRPVDAADPKPAADKSPKPEPENRDASA